MRELVAGYGFDGQTSERTRGTALHWVTTGNKIRM